MRAPKIIVAGLVVVFALSLLTVSVQSAAGMQKPPKKTEVKPQGRVGIPKELKAIIQEGLATRQGRQDIPFTVFKNLYFPTREPQSLHTVFFFQAANEAFGMAVPTPPAPPVSKKEQQAPAVPAQTGLLEAHLNVVLEFFQPDEAGVLKTYRELVVPTTFQEDSATYDPKKEQWYSFDYVLPAGKYTMAMAITTRDLKKIGLAYYDFVLPGPDVFAKALETTPLFFVKSLEQVTAAETRITLHKGMFTYSVLQIVPNLDGAIAAGGQAEVFFFVFGAKAKPAAAEAGQAQQQPAYDIEVNYEVQKEDGTAAIKWAPSSYVSPIIEQQLPLKQTLKIKDDKGERTEQKDLPAGKYVMVITAKDKVSGETIEKKLPLQII